VTVQLKYGENLQKNEKIATFHIIYRKTANFMEGHLFCSPLHIREIGWALCMRETSSLCHVHAEGEFELDVVEYWQPMLNWCGHVVTGPGPVKPQHCGLAVVVRLLTMADWKHCVAVVQSAKNQMLQYRCSRCPLQHTWNKQVLVTCLMWFVCQTALCNCVLCLCCLCVHKAGSLWNVRCFVDIVYLSVSVCRLQEYGVSNNSALCSVLIELN